MAMPFPQPRHVPCTDCGAAVERSRRDDHVCDPERALDYEMFQLRDGIAAAADDLAAFLDSTRGRFELWYAEQDRKRQTGGET
jgi:hypothetical protein